MIRLKSLLTEVAELSPYPYKYDAQIGRGYFTTRDGTKYEVYAGGQEMEISFGVYGDSSHRDTDVITNAGDQYRVMTTIMEIVKRAVAAWKPTTILFGASGGDTRRTALYMRYITPLLRDYDVAKQRPDYVELTRKGWLRRATRFDWTGIGDK